MFGQMWRTFRAIFTTRNGRLSVSGLLLAMAMIPVVEILVIRMFSTLIIDGPAEYRTDPDGVIRSAILFFLAYVGSRGLHHALRFVRVRVFRNGFDASQDKRSPSQESWEWALAFELSNVVVSVIQTIAFSALFLVISWRIGLVNVIVCAVVFWLISMIYGRQLTRQIDYISSGSKPGATSIGERVGSRIKDAEVGSVLSSLAMALVLVAVLIETVRGDLESADAIVLFLGLRLLYGQVGHLSGGVMRFARALARRNTPPPARPKPATPKSPTPSKHRGRLVEQTLAAGRSGDVDLVREFGERLATNAQISDAERAAVGAAESFALYARPVEGVVGDSIALMWVARPFPGEVDRWLSPFLLREASGQPVHYVPPRADLPPPHLVLSGAIGRHVTPSSIVAGVGISSEDVELDPGAVYHSLRGPLTAERLEAGGGPSIERFGDPVLLVARAVPLERGDTNGRIAIVRDPAHASVPLTLPDHLHELDSRASTPSGITEFLTQLIAHDAVATSSLTVAAACHAYGIPCALVTFDGAAVDEAGSGLKFRDYSLGAGLDKIWEPQTVPTDLGSVTWDDLLAVEQVTDAKLDEISEALDDAVATYQMQIVIGLDDEDAEADA